ncbi:MAG: chalcone isomerase family protein [Massilia sp.]
MVATRFGLKHWFAGAALALTMAHGAQAVEVNGIKFDDTAKVAGKELVLNGAGLRTKVIFKVYAAGLYLTEKKTTVADVLRQEGPRRMTLVMMRDVSSDDFGDAFMKGINENTDATEKAKYAGQIAKFGELFGGLPGVKKGDVLHLDLIPGSGTQAELNGKKVGELIPDPSFYNAMLRIWLGDKPADRNLKPALLGASRS